MSELRNAPAAALSSSRAAKLCAHRQNRKVAAVAQLSISMIRRGSPLRSAAPPPPPVAPATARGRGSARLNDLVGLGALSAGLSVVIIDVVLAGGNAIVVGMAAAGLPAQQRQRVIVIGIAAATVLRVALATVATWLLAIIGLTLAGGVLLLWVAWKFSRELWPRHNAAPRRR